jgi:flagellar hook assembly protein FlgD
VIYTSRGKFTREMAGVYDPNAANTGDVTVLDWDGRDAAGVQVSSGYYFIVMTLSDPDSGMKKTSATCIFMINDADQDKVK